MINNVIIEGNITDDPKGFHKGDTNYCKFSIAYNEKFKDVKKSHFFNCIAFGQTAKFMIEYIKKGDLISVIGKLQHDRWENDEGKKFSAVSIFCQNVYILKKKIPTQNNYVPSDEELANSPEIDFNADDIPF